MPRCGACAKKPADAEPVLPEQIDEDVPDTGRVIPLPWDSSALCAFSHDSKRMTVGYKDEIRVLTVPAGKEVLRVPLPLGNHSRIAAFSPDSKQLILAGPGYFTMRTNSDPAEARVQFWNLDSGKMTRELDLPRAKEVQMAVCFSPDAKLIALRLDTGLVLVELETGKLVTEFVGTKPEGVHYNVSSGRFAGGAFSPDGTRFAGGTNIGQFAVWDTASGKQLGAAGSQRILPEDTFTRTAFSPDGRRIATSDIHDPTVQIRDARTGKLVCEPIQRIHSDPIAWTPDGTMVVTGCGHTPAPVAIDADTGKVVRHDLHPPGSPHSWNTQVRGITPDGRYLVVRSGPTTGVTESSIRIYRLADLVKPKG